MSATAILFPGQGVQTPEMREDVLRWCPELDAALEAAVGERPFERLDEGTQIVQPALYCANVAGWRLLQDRGVDADVFAGHSLGEFAALVAADSLDAEAGLELVVARGRITADTGRSHDGGMLAVMGARLELVEPLAEDAGVYVANGNSPRQAVLSGERSRLAEVADEARGRGLRAVMLDVEGAFHCPAMQDGVAEFRRHLDAVDFRPSRRPVYCGLTAQPFEDLRRQLADSLTRTVRWHDLMVNLHESGVRRFIDAGPGGVLAGLAKRTLPEGSTILTAREVAARPIREVARATNGGTRSARRSLRPPRPTPAAFVSMGPPAMSVPDTVVGNAEVAGRLGIDERWIERRTGVRERRWAGSGERVSTAAAETGRVALRRAGIEPADLDLLLVATVTADELMPNTAPLVAAELGALQANALDVGGACAGFLSGVSVGTAAVESGRARNALLIGVDFMSRYIDRDDRPTASVFGDGAGAVTFSAGDDGPQFGPVLIHTDPAGPPLVYVNRDDSIMHMEGPETFRIAVDRIAEVSLEAAEEAGVSLRDVDLFVYHQANTRILRAVGERLDLDPSKVVDCVGEFGNTSAASIPIALCVAEEAGRLQPGAIVLSGGIGAGFVYGAFVMRWSGA